MRFPCCRLRIKFMYVLGIGISVLIRILVGVNDERSKVAKHPKPISLGDSLLKGGFVPFHDWFCSRLTSFLLVLLLPPSVTYFALCVPTRPARFSLREFYVQKKEKKKSHRAEGRGEG